MFVWSCLILFNIYLFKCATAQHTVVWWSWVLEPPFYMHIPPHLHRRDIVQRVRASCLQLSEVSQRSFTRNRCFHQFATVGWGLGDFNSKTKCILPEKLVWCSGWIAGKLWKHHAIRYETLPFPPSQFLDFCVWIVCSWSSRAGGWECFIEAGGKVTPWDAPRSCDRLSLPWRLSISPRSSPSASTPAIQLFHTFFHTVPRGFLMNLYPVAKVHATEAEFELLGAASAASVARDSSRTVVPENARKPWKEKTQWHK